MRGIGIVLVAGLLSSGLSLKGQVQRPTPDVAPATVVTMASAALGSEQQVTILLPSTYAQSRRLYPVLYLLHGGGQDQTAFATRNWFRAQHTREMIIVTPSVGDSWYVKIYLRWEYHGLGLGRRMMEETARRFLERGIHSFILFAELSNPTPGFYDRMGGERLLDDRGTFGGAYGWRDVSTLIR
jgi:GNAT superfamily N-acetyltransferase